MAGLAPSLGEVDDAVDVEAPLFLCQAGIEHHLEEQVAQFIFQSVEIARVNRVNDFVGLFEQQPLEGIVVLLAVPRAAVGSSEMRHQINKLG